MKTEDKLQARMLEEFGKLLDKTFQAVARRGVDREAVEISDTYDPWRPAANVTEPEREAAMAAFSSVGGRPMTILVWDDHGPVAKLSANVAPDGRLTLERRDGGYMHVRLVDGDGEPVGDPLESIGDAVLGPAIAGVRTPMDLAPYLQVSFPEDDLPNLFDDDPDE